MELALALLVTAIIVGGVAAVGWFAVRAASGHRLEASMRSFNDSAVLPWRHRETAEAETRAA